MRATDLNDSIVKTKLIGTTPLESTLIQKKTINKTQITGGGVGSSELAVYQKWLSIEGGNPYSRLNPDSAIEGGDPYSR